MDTGDVFLSDGFGCVGIEEPTTPQHLLPHCMCMCHPKGWIDHHCKGTSILHLTYLSSGWSASTLFYCNYGTSYIVAHCMQWMSNGSLHSGETTASTCVYYTISILVLRRASRLGNSYPC